MPPSLAYIGSFGGSNTTTPNDATSRTWISNDDGTSGASYYYICAYLSCSTGSPDIPTPALASGSYTVKLIESALHPSDSTKRLCVWEFHTQRGAAPTTTLNLGTLSKAHWVDAHIWLAQGIDKASSLVQVVRADGSGAASSYAFNWTKILRYASMAMYFIGTGSPGINITPQVGEFTELGETNLSTQTTGLTAYRSVGGGFAEVSGTWTGASGVNWSAFGIEIHVRPFKAADRGTLANTTTGTTSLVDLPTGASIGQDSNDDIKSFLIARVSADNSGTNGASPSLSITDPRGNTWTVLPAAISTALIDPGAANAGQAAWICWTRVDSPYSNGDDITFNWNPTTPGKAIVIEEWRGFDPTNPQVTAIAPTVASGSSTVVATGGSITPTDAEQVVYACLGVESGTADSFADDTESFGGTGGAVESSWWVGVYGALTRTGSGTTTSGATVAGSYKVTNASGQQTWNPTITSRDWAMALAVFQGYAVPPFQPKLMVVL